MAKRNHAGPNEKPNGDREVSKAAQAVDAKAAALRANLAKRKGQSGARRSGKAIAKTERSAFDANGDD